MFRWLYFCISTWQEQQKHKLNITSVNFAVVVLNWLVQSYKCVTAILFLKYVLLKKNLEYYPDI